MKVTLFFLLATGVNVVYGNIGDPNVCGCNSKIYTHSFHYYDSMKAEGKGRAAMRELIDIKVKNCNEMISCREMGNCPSNLSLTGSKISCVNGQAAGYPCLNVDLLSSLNLADLGYPQLDVNGNDMWVWHDIEYQDEYVIMGTSHGSSFVRVTDRLNPVVVGILNTQTTAILWRDIKVVGNYALIVSEALGHGMQVFDMRHLRGLGGDNTRVFTADVVYDLVSTTHNIATNEDKNRVFLVGSNIANQPNQIICDGGLHIVDVSDPLNPTFLACYGGDGYIHDAQCITYNGPDTNYIGREICFCYNEDTFSIVDTDDPSNIQLLSKVSYTGTGYTHQGWNTEDNMWMLMDDELDETHSKNKRTRTFVWNIQNLKNPTLENTYFHPVDSVDHNSYIKGDYAHQANYMSGYRILSLTALPQLNQVGYFDVYPESNAAEFNGAWSNYPYFEDGAVAVSTFNYGLFMLQPNSNIMNQCNTPPKKC